MENGQFRVESPKKLSTRRQTVGSAKHDTRILSAFRPRPVSLPNGIGTPADTAFIGASEPGRQRSKKC
jgi:hypothetical protein